MKTRVTVTLDENLLLLARRHAWARGKSLSQLLETLVDENLEPDVSLEDAPPAPPCFSEEWQESKAQRLAQRALR